MNYCSQATPIVSEIRNITEGLTQGDFTKAAVNTGILGASAALSGSLNNGALKVVEKKLTANFIAGMSMGMIPFKESIELSQNENIG